MCPQGVRLGGGGGRALRGAASRGRPGGKCRTLISGAFEHSMYSMRDGEFPDFEQILATSCSYYNSPRFYC